MLWRNFRKTCKKRTRACSWTSLRLMITTIKLANIQEETRMKRSRAHFKNYPIQTITTLISVLQSPSQSSIWCLAVSNRAKTNSQLLNSAQTHRLISFMKETQVQIIAKTRKSIITLGGILTFRKKRQKLLKRDTLSLTILLLHKRSSVETMLYGWLGFEQMAYIWLLEEMMAFWEFSNVSKALMRVSDLKVN